MSRLDRLLRPQKVAVIGGDWAANVAEQLRGIGFRGDIWPVHPTRDEICGLPVFSSLEELPGPPDAAFVGVNREASIDVVRLLHKMGSGGAVCFASGYLESDCAKTGGGELQARLVDAAGSMPILGPNCYGFINYFDGVAVWPDQHGGTGCRTGVAILTQSSNIAINMTMQRRGLPIGYMATAGNQAQTCISEIAVALLDDPRVTALGLHIEGFGDIAAFEAMAAHAKSLGKPTVALKTGYSEQARTQTLTHTASLAGSEAGARALLERNGVAAVRSIPVFLETLKLLHVHGALPGNRLVSVSCSGGEASLMADLAREKKVTFPSLTARQTARLNAVLGPMVTLANPLDYHTYIWGKSRETVEAFSAALDAPLDLAFFILDWPRGDRCNAKGWDIAVDAVRAATKATGTRAAVVASMPENMPEHLACKLLATGIAPLCGMEEAILAAEAAALAGAGQQRPLPVPAHVLSFAGAVSMTLNEAEAKAALREFGLHTPRGRLCVNRRDVRQAALEIGFPLALKGLGIFHKTEAGAVFPDLRDRAALGAALSAMDGLSESFLVEEMVSGGLCELIVGVVRDPAHGLVLTIGAGGTLAELARDSASLILPVRDDEIAEKLSGLRVGRLLDGFRGKPAADLARVIEAIQAIATFGAMHRERIFELEVNPLIVTPTQAVAVDALIRLAPIESADRKESAA